MRQSSTVEVTDSSRLLKRQSQIFSAMARSKTVSGSSEDLTSLSSSTSLTSLYSSVYENFFIVLLSISPSSNAIKNVWPKFFRHFLIGQSKSEHFKDVHTIFQGLFRT